MSRRQWAGWGAAFLLLAPQAAADVVPPGWTPPARDAAVLQTCLPAYEQTYGARGRPVEIRRSWETRSSVRLVAVHPEDAVRNPVLWNRLSFEPCYGDRDPAGPERVTASVALVLRAGPERASVSEVAASSADRRVDARCIEKILRDSWSERIATLAAQVNLEISFMTSCREVTTAIHLPPIDLSQGSGGGGQGEGIQLGSIGTGPPEKPQKPSRAKKPRRSPEGKDATRHP